jgi:hypothetical protein
MLVGANLKIGIIRHQDREELSGRDTVYIHGCPRRLVDKSPM